MSMHQEYVHINGNFFMQFISKDFWIEDFIQFFVVLSSLRKVKLDQRKLTDNINSVSSIARVRRLINRSTGLDFQNLLDSSIGVWYCFSNAFESGYSRIKISRIRFKNNYFTGNELIYFCSDKFMS